jgi:predicted esterase
VRAAGVIVVATFALAVGAPAANAARGRAHPAPRYHADGQLGEWRGTPTDLGGRTQLSRGELIHTDYLYDDYGADLNRAPDMPTFRAALAPTTGDYRYPDDPARYGYNAADLREVRFAADASALHALIALQTMKAADAAVAMIAIDTDGDAATGAARWPDGAGITTPGADRFVTVSGSAGHVTDAAGKATSLTTAANLDANAIAVDIPLSLLGPVSPKARVWVVTGLAAAGARFAEQSGQAAAFDVAFQGDDNHGPQSFSPWSDYRQSRALAGHDVAGFSYPLDMAALRERSSKAFRISPGFYDVVFRSGQRFGEGINLKSTSPGGSGSISGTADPMFLSPHQTYGLYIPSAWRRGAGPTPLLLNGHSLDVNHNEYANVSPNFLRQIGEERGSLILTPLARGIDTWYLDAGMVDTFEAWRDVKRRFKPDPERTALGGYSMGGYLSYRLGLLMPDAFTRVADYVGPPAYYQWPYPLPVQSTPEWQVRGNTNLIVDNGLNLPYEINQGNADELVPVNGVQRQVDDFKAAGNPYRFYRHVSDDHFSFVLNDVWTHTKAWLGNARRDLSPVEVRYKRYPSMDLPKAGLTWDGAYWVRDIVVRRAPAESDFGEVWATDFARGGFRRKVVDEGSTAYAPGEGGVSPASVTGQHVENGAAIARRNGFEARFQNVGSVLFRTGLMGLKPAETVTASLTGDGATTVRFDGTWPARLTATLDGKPVTVKRERNGIALALELAAGRAHALSLR